tara:strand:- start:607 stop:1278 length:672 start_codon:yes stop_codon:yes gene_type:complete
MLRLQNKKILFYISLFFIIGTFNNKNLNSINLLKIDQIKIDGLTNEKNNEIAESLEIFKIDNLFVLNKFKIIELLNSYNHIEDFSVFKKYPSSLNIKLNETKYLAVLNKENQKFYIGSNGKLIKFFPIKINLPFVFGNFRQDEFLKLKQTIDKSNFRYDQVKNLFHFPSGRWDIETISGKLLKLPRDNLDKSLNLFLTLLENKKFKNSKVIDLRQSNQVIIND